MFAEPPGGTVTTQKAAPPAPSEPPEHVFGPSREGSQRHGVPLQLPPVHSMLTAQLGVTAFQLASSV